MGVAAFQVWRAHYRSSYAWFLRESFGEAARLAVPLFAEGDLDWVLTCADPQLSTAIERALFYLSRFDFATVEQDVLSGVYGQFLDNAQRKEYGEHYTYGFSRPELEAVWRDFETDPMLRRVQPNLPFAKRRRLGLRTGLTASDRFTRAYRTRSQAW